MIGFFALSLLKLLSLSKVTLSGMANIRRRGKRVYSSVKSFLDRLNAGDNEKIEFSDADSRLAVAALYYRVIMVDGQIRPAELERYRQILSDSLGVSEDELGMFEELVQQKYESEMTLFPLASTVRKLPIEKRREILIHMQQISLSDKELHEFEINLVERAAELLDLTSEWAQIIPKA